MQRLWAGLLAAVGVVIRCAIGHVRLELHPTGHSCRNHAVIAAFVARSEGRGHVNALHGVKNRTPVIDLHGYHRLGSRRRRGRGCRDRLGIFCSSHSRLVFAAALFGDFFRTLNFGWGIGQCFDTLASTRATIAILATQTTWSPVAGSEICAMRWLGRLNRLDRRWNCWGCSSSRSTVANFRTGLCTNEFRACLSAVQWLHDTVGRARRGASTATDTAYRSAPSGNLSGSDFEHRKRTNSKCENEAIQIGNVFLHFERPKLQENIAPDNLEDPCY